MFRLRESFETLVYNIIIFHSLQRKKHSMSCEFLKDTSEILIEKLNSEIQFEIFDILPANELGQDTDEVVLRWSDPIYQNGLNEMIYYIHLTMDELTVTLGCLEEVELLSIIDPDYSNLDKLTQEIKSNLIK